jgi:hypothetical protein
LPEARKEAVVTTVKQEAGVAPYTLRILSKDGDTRYAYSPDDTATEAPEGATLMTVAEVEAKFDEMVKELRFLAYTVPTDGSMGTATRKFDPEVSIVLTPQMQGG